MKEIISIWNDVEEDSLPKEDIYCLATIVNANGSYVDLVFYKNDAKEFGWWSEGEWMYIDGVTAWMLKPQPYKK